MKKLWIVLLLSVLLLFFIPVLLLKEVEVLPVTGPETVQKKEAELCDVAITVLGTDKPLTLEEYVTGVVAAEMPATFHNEALKAQAIAARTYALRLTENGKNPIAADVSAQVFLNEDERKKRWGKAFANNEKKVKKAIQESAGEIVLYEDELITAMFFSTSNGKTETAQNFGGNEIPYLQSVESLGEADVAPAYEESIEITLGKWNAALGSQWDADMFKALKLVRNSTGRVQKVVSTGYEVDGREMRELLGLRSTDFDIAFDVTNEIVHIKTLGNGHGVGMSQYGAEVLAQEGWSAKKIIQHYYTGTTIKKMTIEDPTCLKSP